MFGYRLNPANVALFRQLKDTSDMLQRAFEENERKYNLEPNLKDTTQAVVNTLDGALLDLLTTLRAVGPKETEFYRDFVSFFNVPGYDRLVDSSSWAAYLHELIKRMPPPPRLEFPLLESMQIYDCE